MGAGRHKAFPLPRQQLEDLDMSVHSTTKPNVPVLYEQKKGSVPVRYGVPRTDDTEATRQATDYAARRKRPQHINDLPELTEEAEGARESALAYARRINNRYAKQVKK
jgi:hypothetical protein